MPIGSEAQRKSAARTLLEGGRPALHACRQARLLPEFVESSARMLRALRRFGGRAPPKPLANARGLAPAPTSPRPCTSYATLPRRSCGASSWCPPSEKGLPRVTGLPPVIAIDGPGGAGKGSVAAAVADELGWHLLDSGALYRAVGVCARQRGVAEDDATGLVAMVRNLTIRFTPAGVTVDGEVLGDSIRGDEAAATASRVAALAPVRAALLAVQRGLRMPPGLVADGRDMATVVFSGRRGEGVPHRKRGGTRPAPSRATQAVEAGGAKC